MATGSGDERIGGVIRRTVGNLRDRIIGTTTGLFSHGPQPLAQTIEHAPDPGLLGPDSVSWRVIGDVTAFVGGIRALIVQTAHPEVVAGVEEHSRYRDDPLGRLSRTSFYVTETTYGSVAEAEAAADVVRGVHERVRGRSARGRPYAAAHPELAAWVHNALTDSFLTAYRWYGPEELTTAEADRFVVEQQRIGSLLGADPMPSTADELSAWIAEHPALASSDAQTNAVAFLRDPPLTLPVRLAYHRLFDAAAATLPERVAEIVGVEAGSVARHVGGVAVDALRWALGSSPAWHLALVRVGADVPPGVFHQPLPPEARELQSRRPAD